MSDGTANGGPRRPNMLFFICDQLRAGHLGFAGNPIAATLHPLVFGDTAQIEQGDAPDTGVDVLDRDRVDVRRANDDPRDRDVDTPIHT